MDFEAAIKTSTITTDQISTLETESKKIVESSVLTLTDSGKIRSFLIQSINFHEDIIFSTAKRWDKASIRSKIVDLVQQVHSHIFHFQFIEKIMNYYDELDLEPPLYPQTDDVIYCTVQEIYIGKLIGRV